MKRLLFVVMLLCLIPGCTITTSVFLERDRPGHKEAVSIGATYVPQPQPKYLP